MKKMLIALVALTMTASAFADGHSMVKLDNCTNNGRCTGLDLMTFSNDADAKNEDSRIALNYAMAFAGNFGAGLTYITEKDTSDGDKNSASDASDTIGLSFYWNKAGSFSDSCFAALHYDMETADTGVTTTAGVTTDDDDDYKKTTISLQYGHRYPLGKVAGVTMNWVPSATYAMGTTNYGKDGKDDLKTTTLSLQFANFAATF